MSLPTITAVISGLLGLLRRRPRTTANPVPPAAIWLLLAALVHLGVSHAAEFKPGEDPFQPAAKTGLDDLLKLEVPTVYGASKQTQRASEAPSAVTVISAEEIKKYGHRTLGDVLASVPGFYLTSDRNNAFVGVRGFNRGLYPNSRLLLLVDGHRVNNNLYDGGLVGTEFILDLDLIDRVEIIRGPGSVLYGNNAFFGVVSVITRRGRDLRGPEISGEVSSFDTYRGRVSYGNKFQNDLELFLSGTWSESLGPRRLFYQKFNQATNNFGIAQGLDDDHGQSFFGKLAYNDFSLQGAWMTREKGNPTAQFGTIFNDPRLRTSDERSYASLQYSHEFPDVVDVTAQVYYDRGDFSVDYPRAATLLLGKTPNYTVLPLNRDLNQGEWWGAEAQLQRAFWEKHVLTLGGEYRDDFRLERANLNAATGVLTGTPRTADRQSHGLYVQGDFTLHSSLHLVSGVRYDQYGGFESQINPRHALVYNPAGSSVFKFIYGTAFRAPTFIESINQLSAGLRPETITGYEFIYEQGIGPHLRSTLSLFYNQIDNLIVFDSTGKYSNAGNALAKGLEAGIEGFWTGGIRTRASYTLQEAEDQASGARLADSPRHLGKLNLSAPLLRDRLFAGLEWQYTSGRMATGGAEAAGFGIVNATLFSQKLARGLEISASVYNLLDRQYSDPATPLHQQDTLQRGGRSFRVKVSYRF